MRTVFTNFAWTLATAALVVATPLQTAADSASRTTIPIPTAAGTTTTAGDGAVRTTSSPDIARAATTSAFAAATVQRQDTGRGWAELYCMTCVGLGTLALYSGGITMLPVILGNASMYGTLAGTCLLACESVINTLLK